MGRYAFWISLLVGLSVFSSSDAAVVHVDAGATGDGSGADWPNACTTITAGLAVAATGDHVWVKSATYEEAIALKEGISLYGGFPTNGTPTFEERDWVANETVIDASGWDAPAVYVRYIESATLDGFIITGGNAQSGGGVYCTIPEFSLSNCIIVGNTAEMGGGGIGLYTSARPTISDCTIERNSTPSMGGGIRCSSSNAPKFIRCAVRGNSALSGGGMYCYQGGALVQDCTFEANGAHWGGGVAASYSASLGLTRCRIADNMAWGSGGGVYTTDHAFTSLRECSVIDNTAMDDAGGVYFYHYGNGLLLNCLITGNTARDTCGGVYCNDNATVTLKNCTVADNLRSIYTSGVELIREVQSISYSYTTLVNCIVWNHSTNAFDIAYAQVVRHCCIKGWSGGEGNISRNPGFVDPQTGDYRLRDLSPCIDTGSVPDAPPRDIEGNRRPGGDYLVDRGAYESPDEYEPRPCDGPKVIYVRADADPGGDGTSWDTALSRINTALETACPGDEIWVAAGTFRENLAIEQDVTLYGGFPDDGTPAFEDRDWLANETIVSPSVEYFPAVAIMGGASMDGFTITGPLLTQAYSAVYCPGGSPRLANCSIVDNSVIGFMCRRASPTLVDCRFSGNVASFRRVCGSAVDAWRSTVSLLRCTVDGNTVVASGGSVYGDDSTFVIAESTIAGDVASGLFLHSSSATVTNCFITGNADGGVYGADVALRNCTIAGNRRFGVGGSGISLVNCILWNHGPELFTWSDGPIEGTHCCVQGGFLGDGNFDAYPLFTDYFGRDYSLQNSSPCIDAGTEIGLPYNGAAPDVGAYETPGWYEPGDRQHVPRIIHVAADGAPGGDGSTWEEAYASLGEAFLYSGTGDEVWVKSETYYETVLVEPEVDMYGGFEGWETERAQADWKANPTVIDATGRNASAVLAFGDCMINGFTITGGSAECGGGVSVWDGSPTISNCVITRNTAWSGGGISSEYRGSPVIRGCTITGNCSTRYGGGVYFSDMEATLSNCVITGNCAQSGGGVFVFWAEPVISNCLISLNTAEGGDLDPASGGGVHCYASSPRMTNCTMTGNSAEVGAGFFCEYDASPVLSNCVLWNDAAAEIAVYNATPTVTWSDVRGGYEGQGNIDADPLFADPGGGDYRLTAGSPCIDAGSNEATSGVVTDLDGNVRIWDGDDVPGAVVDMGAYEFGSMLPMLPGDTDGNGVVNALDLFFFSRWWQQAENETNFRCDCVDDSVIDEYDLHRLMMDW